MKNNFKNLIYPLLILMISASCSAPRYASAQDDGYYDNNNNQSYPNQNDDNYSYDQSQGNYNNQEYDPNNYEENPADVNINTFNDALNPYGRWIESPEYGRCWIAGEPGFVPYSTGGHWLYSSYGWTWASDYAWGWAPFHYGRWAYDPFYGWMWVPGYEWGPAWVAWRTGGGFYGWSPLGPGISIGIGFGGGIPYNRWVFAPCRYMGYSHINRYYIAPSRNVTIIHNTTVINNTTVYNNHTFIAGPNRSDVERVTGRRINAVQIQNASAPGRTVVSQNRVQMYRPGVRSRLQNANIANGNANTQLRNADVNNPGQRHISPTNNDKPYVTNGHNQIINNTRDNPRPNQNVKPVPDQRYRLDNQRQQLPDNNQLNQNSQLQNQQRQQQFEQQRQQQMQQRQQQMQERQQQLEQRQQQIEQRKQQNSRPPETRQFDNSFSNRSQFNNRSQQRQPSFSQPHFNGGGRSGKHNF